MRLVETPGVGMLPHGGGPRLPQIGTRGEHGVESRLQLTLLQQWIRHDAVGQDTLSRAPGLHDQFAMDKFQRRLFFGGSRARFEQRPRHSGEVHVETQRAPQTRFGGGALALHEQGPSAQSMGRWRERIETFRLVEHGKRGGGVAAAQVRQRPLAVRPDVGPLHGQQCLDGGDVLRATPARVFHQGLHAQFVQCHGMRKTFDHRLHFLARRHRPTGIGLCHQSHDGMAGGGVQRFARQHPAPVGQRSGGFTAQTAQLGGGALERPRRCLAACPVEKLRGAFVLAVPGVGGGGEKQHFAVVGAALQRLGEHGGGGAGFMPFAVRPEQRARGLCRAGTQPVKPCVEQPQRRVGFAQVSARAEELPPQILPRRRHARRQPGQRGAFGKIALLPADSRQRVQVRGFGRLIEQRPGEELARTGSLPGVHGEFGGQFAPQVRLALRGIGDAGFQPRAGFDGARQSPQRVQFFQP